MAILLIYINPNGEKVVLAEYNDKYIFSFLEPKYLYILLLKHHTYPISVKPRQICQLIFMPPRKHFVTPTVPVAPKGSDITRTLPPQRPPPVTAPPPATAPPPGSQRIDRTKFEVNLDDFKFVDFIGSGGQAHVDKYECKVDTERYKKGDFVAVKEMKCPDRDRGDLEREIEALAVVNHEAILSLIGCTPFDKDAEKIVLITPLMKGSLSDMINLDRGGKAPKEWTETKKHIVLYGIACGMQYMHDQRWIHRDLKPQNVLLNDKLEPKIADFGLSKYIPVGQTLLQSRQCGTYAYMAPEEVETGTEFGFKADVYSFGMTMYALLSGESPWHGQTPFLIQDNVAMGKRPKIPDYVSPLYRKLIEDCWQQDPKLRPTFSDIVQALGQQEFLDVLDVGEFLEYQKKVAPPRHLCPDIGKAFIDQVAKTYTGSPRVRIDHLAELKKRADGGDADAQVRYGNMLMEGTDSVKKDRGLAVHYYKLSADQGNIQGMLALSKCLLHGRGVKRDVDAAVVHIREAVKRNDPIAKDRLGTCYKHGFGVPDSSLKAVELYKEAAAAGYPHAEFHYGSMCLHGNGCRKNIPEAIKYLRLASDHGDHKGMTQYASLLRRGKHVDKNITEAIRLYRLAANEGNGDAMYCLCEIYRDGDDGIPQDYRTVARYAKMGADKFHFLCLSQYVDCLRDGLGIDPKPAEAEMYDKLLSSPLFASQQNNFGFALEHGKDVKKDVDRAIKCYRMAAENGSAAGAHNLATCYECGTGMPVDQGQAAHWFKKAADLGSQQSQYKYAVALRDGTGVPQNYEEAVRYFRLAATKVPRAMAFLGKMLLDGTGCTANPEEAVALFRQAAENQDSWGCYYLGDAYQNGTGVAKDLRQSVHWYTECVRIGTGGGMEAAIELMKISVMYRTGNGVDADPELAETIRQNLMAAARE